MHTLCAVNILARVCRNRHYLHVTSINRSKVQPSLCVYKGDTPFKFIIPVCHWWIERRQARARLSEHLGHMFLSLGSLDEAVIAFEQQIDESHEGSFHRGVVCDGYNNSLRLPSIRYVCVSCNDVDLCPSCHHDYELEERVGRDMPKCQDHAFVAVPRDIWSTLPSRAALADGTTAEERMHRLLVSFTESKASSRPDTAWTQEWSTRSHNVCF
jgi:hypothetical protein